MAEWIALAATVLGGVVSVSAIWGRLSARMDAHEEKLKLHSRYHEQHYKHADDDDAHWTVREREDMVEKIDDLKRHILRRNGDSK